MPMNNASNGVFPIVILALITAMLAAYTLVAMRLWIDNMYRLTKRLVLPLYFLVVITVIIAPIAFLGYLMDYVHIVKNMDSKDSVLVIGAWIAPGLLYNIIYLIRRDRAKK